MMAIQSAATAFYTAMAHDAAYSAMNNNAVRMNLLSPNNQMSFGALAKADKRADLQGLTDSLMLKLSNVFLENQKEQQAKQKKLDTLA